MPKKVGYMVDGPWLAQWAVYYQNQDQITTMFCLNGAEPVRLCSIDIYHSNNIVEVRSAALSLNELADSSPLDLPWAWSLLDSNQPPLTLDSSIVNKASLLEVALVVAQYSNMEVRWTRSLHNQDQKIEYLSFDGFDMKSPCRKGWSWINICLPLKSTQAVPPGLQLY